MKIAFFTEMGFTGKVSRNEPNMRTEFAWMHVLDAVHYPLSHLDAIDPVDTQYDLGVIIFPKTLSTALTKVNIVEKLHKICTKVAFMQEGPSWYFQDLPLQQSFWMLTQMNACDFCLAHNPRDASYYTGLLEKPCFINPTLLIEDNIKELPVAPNRSKVIIGGNLVRWYGGFNSLAVVKSVIPDEEEIWLPRMGRMQSDELYVHGLNHLPYMNWTEWMHTLSKFKYAVHLNPNTIGGTFSLNCAYLGIPCIGGRDTYTQSVCFPRLSVEPDNLAQAKKLFKKLYTDEQFYQECVQEARHNYVTYFSESIYLTHWDTIKKYVLELK